jgi:hypothetical protein
LLLNMATGEEEQHELQEEKDEQTQLQEQKEKEQEQPQEEKEQLPPYQEQKMISWKDAVEHRSASQQPIADEVWQVVSVLGAPEHVQTYYSDTTSSSGSDVEPSRTYCPVAIVSAKSAGFEPRERMTMCYQLHKIAQQASQIEARLSGYNYRFATLEMRNFNLLKHIEALEESIDTLTSELGLQAFDLTLQKNLLEYHELTRVALCSQLTFTTQELTNTSMDLSNANATILNLQRMVTELLAAQTPWE